jgi:hypothetical protein
VLEKIRRLPFIVRLAIVSLGPGVMVVAIGLVRGVSFAASLVVGALAFAISFLGLNIGRRFGVRDLTR